MDKMPEPQNKTYRSGIRYKLFLALVVFLLFAIIAVAQHVFTEPPVGICDDNGCRFGNTSQNANNYTADNFSVMNYFGMVIGSYVDSYSCNGDYCIYHPWYASGWTYSKNMSTGKIDYSDTSAINVFQSTASALVNNGGYINAKGSFSFGTSTLEVYSSSDYKPLTLDLTDTIITTTSQTSTAINATGGSVSILGGVVNGAIQFFPARSSMLRSELRGTKIVVNNITGLEFRRYSPTQWIYESSASHVNVRNAGFVNNVNLPGMVVSTTDMQFYDIEVAKFGYGVLVNGSANTFNQFHVWGNNDGFRLAGANSTSIIGCWCEDNSRYGLSITNSNDVGATGGIFNYNGHGQYYGSKGTDLVAFGVSRNVTWTSNIISGDFNRYGNANNAPFGVFDTATGVTITNNMVSGVFGTRSVSSTTNGVVVAHDNWGMSPFNFGMNNTAPPAWGANDKYINTSKVPPNTCQSTASGTSNWVYANNGTGVC